MLNGADPLIIIHLKKNFTNDLTADEINSSVLNSLVAAVGIPIPIYLSETLTGVYVDTETRSIDVATRVDPTTQRDDLTLEALPPVVSQTAVDSSVTINLLCLRDSVMLTALIAMAELILSKLVTQEYGISYLNGPTVIFDGLLQRFQTNVNRNDNLVRIDFVLSNAKKETPTPKPTVTPIPKVQGATPV